MPVIMHPVGRGGYNRREDVICIQTALANAKISGHGSFWTGKIDGKMSPDMMDAITIFQHAVRTPANGRMGKNCPTCQSLEKVLPAALKGMVAEKSNAAHTNSANTKTAGSGRQPVKVPQGYNKSLPRDQFLKNLVLPMHLRNDLTAYRGAAFRHFALVMSYLEMKTKSSGVLRFEVEVTSEPSREELRQLQLLAASFANVRALSSDPMDQRPVMN
ncbi:MAG: peptidoglycan-binding domain-containing protein [Alphaproteobacteria bacterium]